MPRPRKEAVQIGFEMLEYPCYDPEPKALDPHLDDGPLPLVQKYASEKLCQNTRVLETQ